jgi:alanyl-tRNA synthetase
MTTRLYRTDAYLKSFTARIVQQLEHAGKPALILDQTAFYPTAGGQPNDLGAINGVQVVDVIERDDGEIVHVLNLPLSLSDSRRVGEGRDEGCEGTLDWPRRFEHMQQHSGQHVLSQAFVRVANLDTIAVHISADENTLDLPTSKLTQEVIERAEQAANEIVMQDLPVTAYEVTDTDLPRIPLRKAPKVTGLIRIVEVQGYDWSACGGTHVRNTAQIGLIKITKAEKRGNETRITFRCGARALRDYARLNSATIALQESLSASRYEVLPAVQKLMAESKAGAKALQEAQAQLISYEAQSLLASTPLLEEGARRIVKAFENRDANELRMLAKQLTAAPKTVVLLGASGEKSALVFARSKDAAGDMNALLKQAFVVLSPEGKAKGGGSTDFAQGGGTPATLALMQATLDGVIG